MIARRTKTTGEGEMLRIVGYLVCALLVLLAAPQGSFAGEDSDRGVFGRWWQRAPLAQALDVDEAMVAKLDALYVERKSLLIDLKAELEKERTALKVMLDQEHFDREAVLRLYDSTNVMRANLGRERMKYFLDMRELIGPERSALLKQYWDERRDRLREVFRREKERLDQEEEAGGEAASGENAPDVEPEQSAQDQ